jgi:hypothetical protein
MQRAIGEDATQQAATITQVCNKSSLPLLSVSFVYDFLGPVEGSIWRVLRMTTLLVVSPSPSASDAFNDAIYPSGVPR